MEIVDLIRIFLQAEAGYRQLDGEIAVVLGWRRAPDPTALEGSAEAQKKVWLRPDSNEPGRVPHYTTSIDAAVKLADQIYPNAVGGCGWENGKASARLGEGPFFEASTPMLALCAAALHRLAILRRPLAIQP